MSLQDDIFDVENHLRGSDLEAPFEKIITVLSDLESECDNLGKNEVALKRVVSILQASESAEKEKVEDLKSHCKEAILIIKELCHAYSHPLPMATIERLEGEPQG